MRARARIVAEADGRGGCRITELTEAAPIGLRVTRDAVYLVGTAQGLLGEDDLGLELIVRKGATLHIRSAAAMLAYASSQARLSIDASVETGGLLDWHPEPMITTSACHLGVNTAIELDDGAGLVWHDECLLGRHGEEPGEIELAISVNYDDKPLYRNQLIIGALADGWDGPAVLGANRAVGYCIMAGSQTMPPSRVGSNWAVLELDGPGIVASALATDLIGLRSAMEDGLGLAARSPLDLIGSTR